MLRGRQQRGGRRHLLGHFAEDELQRQVDRRGVRLAVNQLDVPVARNDADKRNRHVLALAERLEQLAVLRPDQQRILLLVPEMPTKATVNAVWREWVRDASGGEYSAPHISKVDMVGSPTMNLSTSIVAPNGSTISCWRSGARSMRARTGTPAPLQPLEIAHRMR